MATEPTDLMASQRAAASLIGSLCKPETIATICLLAGLWFVTRPYLGIIHDARLYTVQAIAHLDPSGYADDLYFKYGSQDAFSIFSPLLAHALHWVTPAGANFALTLVGEALWISAAIAFVCSMFKTPLQRVVALGAIIALPAGYAGNGIFNYAEPFLTPRLFAEGLILFSMAAALNGRWAVCTILCVIAAAIHPLMAAPGMLFAFCLAAMKDARWWMLAALGMVAAIVLASLGIEPFVRLRSSFAGEWLAIVLQRCRFAFLEGWSSWDYLRLFTQGIIVFIAWPLASAVERRVLTALAVAVAIGLGATAVGDDLLHNVLMTNGQPWRVLWIASLVTNLLAGMTLMRLHQTHSAARWYFTAGVVVLFIWRMVPLLIAPAGVILAVAVGVRLAESRGWQERRPVTYTAFIVTVLALVAASTVAVMTGRIVAQSPGTHWFFYDLAAFVSLLLGGVALIFRMRRVASAICIATALTVVLYMEDRRDAWEMFTEGASPAPSADLANLIGDAKTIYWEDRSNNLLWFQLGRPSYYSCLQGTGAMFYEKTALDYQRRSDALAPLNVIEFAPNRDGLCEPKTDSMAFGPSSIGQIIASCRSLPDLDLLVLATKVDDADPPAWHSPAPQYMPAPNNSLRGVDTYYFYDCRVLRTVG